MEGRTRFRASIAAAAFVFGILAISVLAGAGGAAAPNAYVVHKLVSDEPGVADVQDTNLVNAWGLDARPTSPWWVSDNETDLSTLYRANGAKQGLEVSIPRGAPTGLVANNGSNFVVTNGVDSGVPLFLFDTENGVIAGWSPGVDMTHAIAGVTIPGADYKGLAIAGDRLYAADFHHARVDVFDGTFTQVVNPDAFVDPKIPDGFAPFGIQTIGGKIFVTYAKQDADAEDEVAGQGLGFVDAYDGSGNASRTDRDPRPTERAVGACPSSRRLRGVQRRSACRQLRRRRDQRVRAAARRQLRACRGAAGMPATSRS